MSRSATRLPQSPTPRSIVPSRTRNEEPAGAQYGFKESLALVRADGGDYKATLTKRYLEDQAIVGDDGYVPPSEVDSESPWIIPERHMRLEETSSPGGIVGRRDAEDIRLVGEMKAGECVEVLFRSGVIDKDSTIRWQRVGPDGEVELIENARGVQYVCQDIDIGYVLRAVKYGEGECETAIADNAVVSADESTEPEHGKRKEVVLPRIPLGPSSEAHKLFLRGKTLEAEASDFFLDPETSLEKKKEALKCYVLAAERRYLPAYCSIGRIYELGLAVKRDYEQARGWYKEGVKAECSTCYNNLGVLEYLELGIGAERASAAKWFKIAAQKGNAAAMNNLAMCFEEGVGVEQSFDQAKKYYEMAARSGVMSAYTSLGYTGIINGELDSALDAFNAGLESGNPEAANGLALLETVEQTNVSNSELMKISQNMSNEVVQAELDQYARLSRGLYDIIMRGNSNSLKKQANRLLLDVFPTAG